MDKTGVQAAFVASGLSRLLKDIDLVSRASIRLQTNQVNESSLSIGASKLGGMPDLPPEVSWPERNGLPQSFIAQIHLNEVRPYDTNRLLPQDGMLWFFYDAQQQTFGEAPKFQACSINFASEVTLSQQPQLEIPNFDWTDAEQKKYEELLSTFPTPADRAAIHHRLLGYPDTIQDDMRLECQLVSHGVTDEGDPRLAEVSKGAMDWQLLLQIDSDEHAGMRWGNAGMLYYWITSTALQARHFDTTWLVLQSE